MCTTCGCSPDEPIKMVMRDKKDQKFLSSNATKIHDLELNILSKNDLEARNNRAHFKNKKILSLNLVSSPGSGKTTILERTLIDLKNKIPFYIIEGDQQTTQDALRIQATDTPVVQINTGKACHLDASMVHHALHQIEPVDHSILIIENVGNLVCPALFDLGEKHRIVIMSVTEGDDKPIKYPYMFESADICIINKTDLLPYVDFNIEKAKEFALSVNHKLRFFETSATKGTGMESWYLWLIQEHRSLVK